MERYSIDQAEALYQSNQFQQAEKICRQILIKDPKNAFAMITFNLLLTSHLTPDPISVFLPKLGTTTIHQHNLHFYDLCATAHHP